MFSHSKSRHTAAWFLAGIGAVGMLLTACGGSGSVSPQFNTNGANLKSVVANPTTRPICEGGCGHHIVPQ